MKNNNKWLIKKLAVDMLMFFLFAWLLAFSGWLVWMYYYRGPIDMETRGYVSSTLKETMVQPTEIEKYTLQHFHNLDDAVLNGITYQSNCVTCHGDYSHEKPSKIRAFLNAHSWFVACEVCHSDEVKLENVVFKWLNNYTDTVIHQLTGEPGNYGARIVPLLEVNGKDQRLDKLIDDEAVAAFNLEKSSLSDDEQKAAMDKMHQGLNKEPASCDSCHAEDNLLDFKQLLYPDNMALYLETIDVGTMLKDYEVFHIPNVNRRNTDN